MPIYLRRHVTEAITNRVFGGLEQLSSDWEDCYKSNPRYPEPRKRTALYAWMSNGVPARGDQIFGLCGLLDVDPMALFDFERNGYFSRFASIRRNIQLGLAAVGVFKPLYQMYRPGPIWPSNELALRCYGREWFAVEFNNKEHWSGTDYCLIKARFRSASPTPRMVHIAYRRTNSRDTMWRYFGAVLAIEGKLELYSESGDHQVMAQVEDNEIRFRTYYGGRPVEFRVASLHEFNLSFEFPHNDKNTVGFEW